MKKPVNNSGIKTKRKYKAHPQRPLISKWIEDYFDLNTLKMHPATEASIDRLCADMLAYARLPESIVFRDFLDARGIGYRTYRRWKARFPSVQEVHDLAKGIIGSRREKMGLQRDMDSGFVQNSMYMYDEEWKEMHDEKARVKDQNAKPSEIRVSFNNISGAAHE